MTYAIGYKLLAPKKQLMCEFVGCKKMFTGNPTYPFLFRIKLF